MACESVSRARRNNSQSAVRMNQRATNFIHGTVSANRDNTIKLIFVLLSQFFSMRTVLGMPDLYVKVRTGKMPVD